MSDGGEVKRQVVECQGIEVGGVFKRRDLTILPMVVSATLSRASFADKCELTSIMGKVAWRNRRLTKLTPPDWDIPELSEANLLLIIQLQGRGQDEWRHSS